MKKKKNFKKVPNIIKEENHNNEKKEDNKDVVQPVGSYRDFLIMEKKDKIKDSVLEFVNLESDNLFFKDFIILQHQPNQKKSRFTELFKEMSLKEKNKDKEDDKEIKINNYIDNNIDSNIIPNANIQSMRYKSYDINQNIFNMNSYYQNQALKNNLSNSNQINGNENNFYNPNNNNNKIGFSSLSNPNSRTQSELNFQGHGGSFSSKSTNANTYYKTTSSNSLESNNNIIISNNLINTFQGGGGNMNFIINNNTFIDKDFEPNVDIKKVLALKDKRTTIMIKNIPNKFTRDKLLELIDKNFSGTYDLFILPKDGNKNRNFGYSFINFTSSYFIPHFYHNFNGKKWSDTNSQKVCEITYSKIQGRNELISHYPNKIIFFNDVTDLKFDKFFIPIEYKNLFKQIFPNQPLIKENNFGFITKIPFY